MPDTSGSPCAPSFDLTATSPSPLPPPPHHSHKMSAYLRNLFGGQGQSSKAQGESRSRSRQAPAVAYNYKSSRSATPESSPSRSAGVKRSHSATRSHAPSPLRDVTNEEAQRPTLQRSSTSRSHSKGKSSNAQYNGPGTGKFHPDKVRLFVNIVPRPALPNTFPKRAIYVYPHQLTHWLLCISPPWDSLCRFRPTTFPICVSLSHTKDAVTPCSKE